MAHQANEILQSYLIEVFNNYTKIHLKYCKSILDYDKKQAEDGNLSHSDAIQILNDIDFSKLDVKKIISSSVFSGHTLEHLYYNILSGLSDGYIPILYENELEGRNISKDYYMVTLLKFSE